MTPRRFALLGDPVAHSKSPVMHAAAYRALHMPHTYEAIRATPEDLPRLVSDLRAGAYDGFNVTVPHKRRILAYVDDVDPSAAAVGAANTLVRMRDGRIVAHNTDVPALAGEVLRLAPERPREGETGWRSARVLVLGTGGAARSAIAAVGAEIGVAEVVVRGRSLADPARAEAFLAEMNDVLTPARGGGARPRAALRAEPWRPNADVERTLAAVVQATSAGMDGADPGHATADAVDWANLPARAIALDIIYAPPVTAFLRAAEEHGIRCANGFGMLASQGALAFELWLGVPAPFNAMLTALV